MSTKDIIKDYGTTVSAEVYNNALQGHQYIPQADQRIVNIVLEKINDLQKVKSIISILDLGCGPGRLTYKFAKKGTLVHGIDLSESFINAAINFNSTYSQISFMQYDFASVNFPHEDMASQYDIIVMQGVMHHVHGEERKLFLERCHKLLNSDGILIIGDEFIKPYIQEADRIVNVAEFYLHIIGEAIKGGFMDLAFEEAKNLIDDTLSGEEGAGFANDEIIKWIFYVAQRCNKDFYEGGSMYYIDVQDLITFLKRECSELASTNEKSFNRGDFKVSLDVFERELQKYSFQLDNTNTIGPVDQLGGMAVLTFKQKNN
ncbi:class I SAM-dependent methyltransferase [Candidatus Falkowbacteria bacterium]|nr:MAG: class I SAM-dependent methyltransferase [Candidatus Falkowbacteria bacterium]